ncbi:hypothetical protein SUGI_0018020, partial [Cryptomeria japonica]
MGGPHVHQEPTSINFVKARKKAYRVFKDSGWTVYFKRLCGFNSDVTFDFAMVFNKGKNIVTLCGLTFPIKEQILADITGLSATGEAYFLDSFGDRKGPLQLYSQCFLELGEMIQASPRQGRALHDRKGGCGSFFSNVAARSPYWQGMVVIDNATSYVAVGKLLMERYPNFFWSPCVAHCLDLMLEDIGNLEWVKSTVERAKNISKFIYNHALVLSIMRQYTGQKELARLGITMFASNFLTMKSLMKSKAALRRMFVGEEWTSSSYATTTARLDVVNCIFDEPGFSTPCREIVQ